MDIESSDLFSSINKELEKRIEKARIYLEKNKIN